MFSSPGALSIGDLNRSNPNQQGYGQQQQANQQQQQQQPYQQQQQQPSFSPFGQPSQSSYGLAGSTGAGSGHSLFGTMQQNNQMQQNSHFGGWGGAAGGGVGIGIGGGAAGQQQSSLQNSGPMGGVGASGAQTEYLPGYLSKLRESRPYTSPLNASAASRSPPRLRDQDAGVGPSSSPFNSDRIRGSRADIHSGTGGGGGAGPSGSGDRASGGGAGGSSSPNQRFTSSFFSASTSPGGPDPETGSLGALAAKDFGSKSIFGPSGLRAKGRTPSGSARHTVTFGRTPSFSRGLRPSKSPPPTGSLGPGGASGSAPDEDDFAPPIESLGEDSEMGDTSYSGRRRSFANAATSSSPRRSDLSTQQMVNNTSLSSSFGSTIEDPSLRTILVFGFSRLLESAILDQFSNHGKVESSDWISLDASSASDGCLEIVYKEAYAALRAIRRNGDLLPGIAMVGVRWKDDGKQRESILNGINSPAFTRSGSGSSGALATSSSAAATSSISAHSGKSSTPALASNTGTPNGAANRSLIGRPISVLGTKDAVFAPSPSGAKGANPLNQLRSWGAGGGDSPARHTASPGVGGGAGPSSSLFIARQNQAAPGANGAQTGVQQQQQQAGGATPGSGFLGRINDAVFGW